MAGHELTCLRKTFPLGETMIKNKFQWHARYLKLADEVATWSKDPSSQIGAVAVGDKGQVLSQGYNGFPRGIKDTKKRLEIREEKYKFTVHAEMNCIYNATFNGTSLDGATLYVSGLPVCSECAKGVIQVGVVNVVMWDKDYPENWMESFYNSRKLFDEAGVKYTFVEEKK